MPVDEGILGLEPSLWSVVGALGQVGGYLFTQQSATERNPELPKSRPKLLLCGSHHAVTGDRTPKFDDPFGDVHQSHQGCGSGILLLPGGPSSHPSDQEEHRDTELHEIFLSNSVPLVFCIQQLDTQAFVECEVWKPGSIKQPGVRRPGNL